MPVADYPVHPSTRIGADYRHGCYNRVRKPGYTAPTRVYDAAGDFTIASVFIKDTSSIECHHPTDPACGDCKWKKQ